MASRMAPSSSRSMASSSMPSRAIEEQFGKETGLPLIVCPTCHRERVIELIVKSTENGNQGRVFFKCPRNVPGKAYLKKLVEKKYVVIDLEAGLVGEEDAVADGFVDGEEAQSQPVLSKVGKDIEKKLDALISMFKMLLVVLFLSSFVGLIYVLK